MAGHAQAYLPCEIPYVSYLCVRAETPDLRSIIMIIRRFSRSKNYSSLAANFLKSDPTTDRALGKVGRGKLRITLIGRTIY